MTELPVLSEFQVFVKPVGAFCNLHCKYCYYIGKSGFSGGGKECCMGDDMLETYIRQHIEATSGAIIVFSWHGGEPLLAGIDFYRKTVELQRRHCPQGKRIINGLQTNGTLLDEHWCRFLAEQDFIVGISLDGPEELHDCYRRNKEGNGTFVSVLKGFDMLVMHGVDPEILCVVNGLNVKYPLEVYQFFRHLGVPYITFIPLVESGNKAGPVSERSVDPVDFGRFLCIIFDEWLEKDIGKVKVQIFEEALRTAFHQGHTLCIFRSECGGVPVIERNGDFYSCDHFVNPAYRLGNINDRPLKQLLESEAQRSFGRAKLDKLPGYCRNCEVLDMCNGECPKNRFISTPDGEPGLNFLCGAYKQFFNHCRPFAEEVAKA
jgi:uncharacterized protein